MGMSSMKRGLRGWRCSSSSQTMIWSALLWKGWNPQIKLLRHPRPLKSLISHFTTARDPISKGRIAVNIVQFKYSMSRSDDEFRASDAKKTIAKFGAAFRDHRQIYGTRQVRDKLSFELITNRPIYPAFEQAIKGIAKRNTLSGEVRKQAEQFKAASGLDGQAAS